MTQGALLRIDGLSLSFGGVMALMDVSLEVRQGEILAIIGPNGAGKTCILNCITGFYRPAKGEICFRGKRITGLPAHKIAALGITRTFQNIELFTGLSVLDNLMAGRHLLMKKGAISASLFFAGARKEEVEHRVAVEDVIELLELEPIRDKVVGFLPYGQRKRVDLGRALAMEPKLLLLDEPMAGMNVEEKEDMARFILDSFELRGISMVLIEHDMGVVMDMADRVIVHNFGRIIAEGNPQEIRENPEVRRPYLGSRSQ
ncbi:MAG: ABC transporter ATP-binding protein [Thermodesulfobacteriota bacterium]